MAQIWLMCMFLVYSWQTGCHDVLIRLRIFMRRRHFLGVPLSQSTRTKITDTREDKWKWSFRQDLIYSVAELCRYPVRSLNGKHWCPFCLWKPRLALWMLPSAVCSLSHPFLHHIDFLICWNVSFWQQAFAHCDLVSRVVALLPSAFILCLQIS